MIVVLDANVLVSAILSPKGNPASIIRRWEVGEFDVATSRALIHELERVLGYDQVRKYTKASDEELKTLVDRFYVAAIIVNPKETLNVIEEDPDDNRVLECAMNAGTHYIVTGDKHLLDLKEYKGVVILSPASFLVVLDLEEREK